MAAFRTSIFSLRYVVSIATLFLALVACGGGSSDFGGDRDTSQPQAIATQQLRERAGSTPTSASRSSETDISEATEEVGKGSTPASSPRSSDSATPEATVTDTPEVTEEAGSGQLKIGNVSGDSRGDPGLV